MSRKTSASAAPSVEEDQIEPTADAPEVAVEENDGEILALVQKARFNPEKLIGSVGDFLLSDLRASRELKPWAAMSEADQRALIDRSHNQAREIVRQVIQAVAAKGFSKIDGMLEGGSWKEGEITAKLKARLTAENIEALSTGSPFVQVVFATLEDFEAPMTAKPEPNQTTFIDPETGEVITKPRADGARTADFPGTDDDGDEPEDEPVFDQTDAGLKQRPAR
jgi:cell division protein FtsI/penicillin-binding protein 2